MGLLGAIGAGIGAAGGAMAQMGMERLRSEIEEERMLRLDEMRGKRAEEAEIRKDEREWNNEQARAGKRDEMKSASARAAAVAKVEADKLTAPDRREIAAGDAEAAMGIKESLSPRELVLARKEQDSKLEWEKANAPILNKLARDKARATNIDNGAGLRAIQMDAARLELAEKQGLSDLRKQIDAARSNGDSKTEQRLLQQYALRMPKGGDDSHAALKMAIDAQKAILDSENATTEDKTAAVAKLKAMTARLTGAVELQPLPPRLKDKGAGLIEQAAAKTRATAESQPSVPFTPIGHIRTKAGNVVKAN